MVTAILRIDLESREECLGPISLALKKKKKNAKYVALKGNYTRTREGGVVVVLIATRHNIDYRYYEQSCKLV